MNKHELHGGARYVGGKVEKAVGDAVDSRDWQVSGVVDQVAGGAENLLGRAQSIGEDVADATPGMIEAARERIEHTAHRSAEVVRQRADEAGDALRDHRGTVGWALAAGVGGYALAWLVHGRRR